MKKTIVTVGLGSCGIAAGATKTYQEIERIRLADKLDFELKKTSCVGMCFCEPLVEITDDTGTYLYGQVNPLRADEIIDKHIRNYSPVKEYLVLSDNQQNGGHPFLDGQVKIALRNCGHIDPESIGDYETRGGYDAIRKIAAGSIAPEQVNEMISASGLRGRGGGGFPTGTKWNFARNFQATNKYVICNADEGDPGAFMDRSILEGDPHAVIEGMIICGYTVGASQGYIYCRAEYPLAIKRLSIAMNQAREKGYLGNNLFGISGFHFDLIIKEGAGAFVCGEETALIASIEGQRGMPRRRPPFPAHEGLWKYPTIINNVETFVSVPWIVTHGPESFAALGTQKSKGTKVFALTGKVRNGGLVEVPMGISIRDIVYKLGGGIAGDKKFKAVQLGGPSGGCIPEYLADTPVDFDSVNATGAIMGSGGMVVMDESTCMVDIARFFLDFTRKESCGKCTFCRIGTKRLLEILTRITVGNGAENDLEMLEELALNIKDASLCGLGQTAPNPVLTTLKYFRNEYEAHIRDKKCPALHCKKLLTYQVNQENCTGCMACTKGCPVAAIEGGKREPHFILQEVCIKCGICYTRCKFHAIQIS
ncbi:MAG TPA: NADH-ubiquinone oxidoreductase-F iron-sulfur binding region domain-containing protein [Bacteroidales bacterium]|nr:NADH-ubiquinone oxidoreductase-F iron-sulfur binding region domain-containing protein [Bacteroidales bacterium]